jgi:hypothetical protein
MAGLSEQTRARLLEAVEAWQDHALAHGALNEAREVAERARSNVELTNQAVADARARAEQAEQQALDALAGELAGTPHQATALAAARAVRGSGAIGGGRLIGVIVKVLQDVAASGLLGGTGQGQGQPGKGGAA